jgi:hypothetical protein
VSLSRSLSSWLGARTRGIWSALGPHGIDNRWSSAGTSGHGRHARITSHMGFTATSSNGRAALDRVRTHSPPRQALVTGSPGSRPPGRDRSSTLQAANGQHLRTKPPTVARPAGDASMCGMEACGAGHAELHVRHLGDGRGGAASPQLRNVIRRSPEASVVSSRRERLS